MIKNNLKINNPLTIIAVFTMLTEASAAVSLPYIDSEHQKEYVWFLIAFPLLLITLFFLTLNFNNKTLYTPADLSKAALPLTTTAYTPRAYTNTSTDTPTSVATPPYQPGIPFGSLTPENFTFLPQGHRIYDSDPAKPSEMNSTSAMLSADRHVLLEGTELKNFHLIDLTPPSALQPTKNAPKETLHNYCKAARKCKSNTHKNEVFLLLINTQSGITPNVLTHAISRYKNASSSAHTTFITYNTDTRKLDLLSSL